MYQTGYAGLSDLPHSEEKCDELFTPSGCALVLEREAAPPPAFWENMDAS